MNEDKDIILSEEQDEALTILKFTRQLPNEKKRDFLATIRAATMLVQLGIINSSEK